MGFTPPTIGELRDTCVLQALSRTPNASGSLTDAYATAATVWGRLRTLFGARMVDGAQTQERVTHVLTIRARGDLEAWRYVLTAGHRYRVHSVLNQGPASEWQEVMLEQIT